MAFSALGKAAKGMFGGGQGINTGPSSGGSIGIASKMASRMQPPQMQMPPNNTPQFSLPKFMPNNQGQLQGFQSPMTSGIDTGPSGGFNAQPLMSQQTVSGMSPQMPGGAAPQDPGYGFWNRFRNMMASGDLARTF